MTFGPSLIVTGLGPDHLNSNLRIRRAIVQGAEASSLFASVSELPIETIVTACPKTDFVLAVGGVSSAAISMFRFKEAVRAAGGRLIVWLFEDPYEFDLHRRVSEVADFVFTNERACVPFYTKHVFWLPLGADPLFLRQGARPRRKIADLFFCGYGYANRIDIISKITRIMPPSMKAAIFGENLSALGDKALERRLSVHEMADMAACSTVSLNIGRDFGIANSKYMIAPETPGPRTFDVALSGSAQMMFDDGVLIEHFYEPGKEIILFDSAEEVIQELERARRDGDWIASVAADAYRRTLAHHLYEHRIVSMMKVVLE